MNKIVKNGKKHMESKSSVTFKAYTEYLIGDAMTTLNQVHRYCYDNNTTATIIFQWPYDKDYVLHPEQPETEWERINYIHQFYYQSETVTICHQFEVENIDHKKHLWLNDRPICWWGEADWTEDWFDLSPNWYFDKKFQCIPDDNKVVVFSYRHNLQLPKDWKMVVNNWDEVDDILEKLGYNLVELTHRTSIEEAMYHISTCKFVVSYDGMWHYIVRNLFKPHFVLSDGYFTRIHTPGAVMLRRNHMVVPALMNVEQSGVFERAKEYEDRQSGN